jgi:putative nucleotidyltransferase with HDIG domain
MSTGYIPLPSEVQEICRDVDAPPRLVAHLILVHDVAVKLAVEISKRWPEVKFDKREVSFGAATHDMGKAAHPEELVSPGHKHEHVGAALLEDQGVPENLARFAYTHANWRDARVRGVEDLIVALADNLWKGKRLDELEDRFVGLVSTKTAKEKWEFFSEFDRVCQKLASEADMRLAWLANFAERPD